MAGLKNLIVHRLPWATSKYRTLRSYWTGRRWLGKGMNAFREIHSDNTWNDSESKSGSGSSLRGTDALRPQLAPLLKRYLAKSMLDVPCGDFYWMAQTPLGGCKYIGAELIPEIVQELQVNYGSDNKTFVSLDMSTDRLPPTNLIFCRDCLVHFSYADIRATLRNFQRSGAAFLLTTTYPRHHFNVDCPTGHWRTLNWQLPPFNFPPPIELLWDDVVTLTGPGDKHLGLWRLDSLPNF